MTRFSSSQYSFGSSFRICILGLSVLLGLGCFATSNDAYADAQPKKKAFSGKRHAAHSTKRLKHRKALHGKPHAHGSKSAHANRPAPRMNVPQTGNSGDGADNWFYRRRAWPNETIDPLAYPIALNDARRMQVLTHMSGKRGSLSTFIWTGIGPYSIDGRATCIATHPTDSNLFYVGAASGGLWKTTNHGATWTCKTDTFGTLPIGCVTIDPMDPQTLYLGQGEPNQSGDSYPGNGLWKSTNAGDTWSYLGFANSQYISKLVVDPKNHSSIFVAIPGPNALKDSNRGVFHSMDGGSTWTRSLFIRLGKSKASNHVGIIDIAMNPLNDSELVAYAWDHSLSAASGFSTGPTGPNSGIWRSSDYGASWTRMDTLAGSGLPNGAKEKVLGRGSLLWVAEGAQSYLYAAYTRSDTNKVTHYRFDDNFKGLYRSTDEGLHWTKTVDSTLRIPMGGVQGKDSADIMNAQGGYNMYLAANPKHPEEVYLGGIDVLRSTDHGQSFRDITNSYSDYYVKGNREQHSDQHGLAFTAADGDMLVVSDGGIFHTDDYGAVWNQMKGLPITMFYAIEPWFGGMKNLPDKIGASDLKVFGGTQDNGTVAHGMTSDTAYSWINHGDGGEAQAHPTDPEKLLTSLQLGVIFGRNTLDSLHALPLTIADTNHDNYARWHNLSYRLLRGPNRLTDTTESCAFIAPVVLDPTHPNDLYTAREHVYHATIDWSDLENTKWKLWSPIVGGDPANASHWYYGDIETIALGVPDAAGRPMLWAGGSRYASPSSAVWRTTVDPLRADSTAPTWILANKGLPNWTVSSITPDRTDSLTAFITMLNADTTDKSRVLITTNGGTSWTNISGNLPRTPISALAIDTFAEHGNPSLKNKILIVASDVGVYVTTNGGTYWQAFGTGMPHIVVSDLKIYKNMLIAGTHGRSLYAMDISELAPGALTVAQNSVDAPQLAIFPNPARRGERVEIAASLPATGELNCTLINEASGRICSGLRLERTAGGASIELDRSIAPGSYFIQIDAANRTVARGRITLTE